MLGSLKISMRKSRSSKVMNFMVSGSGILMLTLGRDSNYYMLIYNFDRLFIFLYSCFVQLCHCMLFQDELKILHIKSNWNVQNPHHVILNLKKAKVDQTLLNVRAKSTPLLSYKNDSPVIIMHMNVNYKSPFHLLRWPIRLMRHMLNLTFAP